MPSIISDAKKDALLSGIACKLREEHMDFCDFVSEFGSLNGYAEPFRTHKRSRIDARTEDLVQKSVDPTSPARSHSVSHARKQHVNQLRSDSFIAITPAVSTVMRQ